MDFPVYISTGSQTELPAVEFGQLISGKCDYGVELSAGLHVSDPVPSVQILALRSSVLLHNYFPPPKEPFVLNLSSEGRDLDLSISLVKNALRISHLIGATTYGVHAGFLLQPHTSELGNRLSRRPLMSRDKGLDIMKNSLSELAKYADSLGVKLLVENHVLSERNYKSFGNNFLLMVDPLEIDEVLTDLGGKVGLLLDVGHLAVSANTLGFDALEGMQYLNKHTLGYHISSNWGKDDDNLLPIADDWFWRALSLGKEFYTLELREGDLEDWICAADQLTDFLRDLRDSVDESV